MSSKRTGEQWLEGDSYDPRFIESVEITLNSSEEDLSSLSLGLLAILTSGEARAVVVPRVVHVSRD